MTKGKQTKVNKKQTPVKQTKTEQTVTAPTEKKCPKCGRTLPVANFPHDYRRKDTLYIYCRECEAKRQYDKRTNKIIKLVEAGEMEYKPLRIITAAPVLEIDVLKVISDPSSGKLTETEIAPFE